ncbi:hypothetical protein CLV78_10318 [Aliiruegeria haliotis]|uniref:Uncharacterized protein n=1 Tax=Aliiruegeria haliotis TaxID=1280846 RepID=A0A2T0RSJ9_9RHOB|nr:DUF6478 family protein [Aliiruegeria haliotis]PRY24154.1 hypothetical protein CLV78_10318 [Aliiruegeria haliotis]
MAKGAINRIGGLFDRGVLRRWRRGLEAVVSPGSSDPKGVGHDAQTGHGDQRRNGKRAEPRGDDEVNVHRSNAPRGADCVWRPSLWCEPATPRGHTNLTSGTRLAQDVALFHDCPDCDIATRQLPEPAGSDPDGKYALQIEVFRFNGSFLSLAMDLPSEAISGLSRRHLIGVRASLETERPLEVFARLNVRHGPNTEKISREVGVSDGIAALEFDLAYADMHETRVEAAWIDLIFKAPAMNMIHLQDVSCHRRFRAEL